MVINKIEYQEKLPAKKIYSITNEGTSELKQWITSDIDKLEFKKTFLIRLAWSELLDDDELYSLLSKYENEIQIQLLIHQEKIRRGNDSPERTERENIYGI